MKYTIYILLFFISIKGFTQEFADKEYYLVDSLELKQLTGADVELLETSLNKYHSAKDDTSKINALTAICENMMHDDWSKYQFFQYDLIKQKLKTTNTRALKKSLGDALNNIGFIYKDKGQLKKALQNYSRSLEIRQSINDNRGIAESLSELGGVYIEQGHLKEAMQFHRKSFKIEEKIGNKKGMATSLNEIGVIYNKQGQTIKAMEYFNKSLLIQEEIRDIPGAATSLNNIGLCYQGKGQIEDALNYFHRSLDKVEELGNKGVIATLLINIAALHQNQNQFKEAEAYALKGFEISKEIGIPYNIQNAAITMSKNYEYQGKGIKALEMYKLYVQMKDSINNEETQKATIRQQTKYEFEKVQAVKDKEHEKQLEVEQEAKAKQRVITYATAGGLGLTGIFLFFVMNRLKVTRKQKVVIEQQKEAVEEAHQEIKDSITYAKRIQSAILPPTKLVKEYLKNNFILYKPKDVVAGDFYWMEHKDNKVLFAAADCTGHGVPGAMVSVVCNNALNRSVREHGLTDPGEILTKTREIVIQEFEKSEEEVKDGMDIALCSLEGNKLKYAGAHNPLWIIRPLRHSGLDPESGEKEEKIAGQARNDGFEIIGQ
jgi:tetratricopeptide (TPR) repeat protein